MQFHRMDKGKLQSAHHKTNPFSTDLSFGSDNEFAELVWENGQIGKKIPNFDSKVREKDADNATTNSKLVKFGALGYVSDPSGVMGLNQDDDMVPWLNYPIDDPLEQDDYCSELLPELSSVTTNDLSVQNSFSSFNGRNHSNQAFENLNPVSAIGTSNNTQNPIWGNSVRGQKKDKEGTHTNPSVMNFSHFSRPAAIARANLQSIGITSIPNKKPAPSISTHFGSFSSKNTGFHTQSNPNSSKKAESTPLVSKPITLEQTEAVKDNGVKTLEPVIASSSGCSGNSADGASNELTQNLKRKCGDNDDSEYRSEDIEEESVGARKSAAARVCTGSKRSRASEVHNLSERRRRDRINEKMRALQELIPNCNKVDKASMLDEAIEYLKTLQLQVQIMSMGAGLYMPSMMLTAGMQHAHHAAHMAHFSPMGVAMGMGYNMGMVDMNGGSNYPYFGQQPSQGFPVSMPRPPFGPFSGGPSMNFAAGMYSSGLPLSSENPISAPKDLIQNMGQNADASSSMNQRSTECYTTSEGFALPAAVVKNDQSPD